MSISNKAVEAAHNAIIGGNEVTGPDIALDILSRDQVRHILEAAAPHMLAGAWSTCAVESARCGLLSAADALVLASRNPYGSSK